MTQHVARGGRLIRGVPAPLAALLTVLLIVGFAWALVVPPGQVPDEPNHLQYTQSIAERFELPGDGQEAVSAGAELGRIETPGAHAATSRASASRSRARPRSAASGSASVHADWAPRTVGSRKASGRA
jgi:hypothetical protein